MNKPDKFIGHHSLTDDNKVLSDFQAILKYHLSIGMKDIAYNDIFEFEKGKLVHKDGRKVWENGAHTIGQNTKSIGFCLVGNYDKDTPTEEQYDFIAEKLHKKYANTWGALPFHGHREYAIKTCPGRNFDIKAVENRYRKLENKEEIKSDLKLFPIQILEKCLIETEEWKKGYNAIIDIAKDSSELGNLESFKYLPDLIAKLYYAENKKDNLTPIEILDNVVEYKEDWNKAYNTITIMANKSSDIGDLEIFKFLPDLIKKVYYYL